jgi:ABC-type polysaccharide/polyol phosphate export permease
MNRFFADIKKFGNYISYSARSELKAEVAGSFLGWLWWFLDPLLYMGVYSFIAILIFNRPEPHFPVFVFIGLNCWQFFSKSVKASVKLIAGKKNIVTKVYIPKHMFILEKMGVFGFKMFVSFALTAVFMLFYQVPIQWYIVGVIPLFLLLFLGTFAVCLIIMHFGVFIEDLLNVITVVLQLGFYVSGVFFSIENRLAEKYGLLADLLLNLNPLALIMNDMRNVMIGSGEMHFVTIAIWFVLSAVVSVIGIKTVYSFENSYVKII